MNAVSIATHLLPGLVGLSVPGRVPGSDGAMPTALERPAMTISWDGASRSVLAEWREFAVSQDFRAAMEFGLDMLREQGGSRWISVYRKGIPLTSVDSDWLSTTWLPRAARQGLTRVAFVYFEAALSRIAMRRVLKAASLPGLESAECPTIDEARRWIDRMEAAPLPF